MLTKITEIIWNISMNVRATYSGFATNSNLWLFWVLAFAWLDWLRESYVMDRSEKLDNDNNTSQNLYKSAITESNIRICTMFDNKTSNSRSGKLL